MIDIIINPAAGSGHAKKVGKEICNYLNDACLEHRVYFTEYPGHARKLARASVERGTSTVLCVGGDGTAFEVAGGLVDSDTAMGIIPAGTGNDFLKTLKLSKSPIENLKHILSSEAKQIDLGQAGEIPFLNICGTGIDTQVIHYADRIKKYVRGLAPYLLGILIAIWKHKPYHLRVTIDEEEVIEGKFLLCSVANGRYYGGGIPIAPHAEVRDAFLDVILVQHVNKLRIPFYLAGLLNKKVMRYRISKFYRAKTVEIENLKDQSLHINEDGDVFQAKKIRFSIRPQALKIHC